MSVEERMREAVRAACAGSVPPESQALIVHAVTTVATTDNRKLLDMLKAKDAEIDRLETEHTPGSLVALGYRQTFAAMAMQAMLSNPARNLHDSIGGTWGADVLAVASISYADALIAALEAKP